MNPAVEADHDRVCNIESVASQSAEKFQALLAAERLSRRPRI